MGVLIAQKRLASSDKKVKKTLNNGILSQNVKYRIHILKCNVTTLTNLFRYHKIMVFIQRACRTIKKPKRLALTICYFCTYSMNFTKNYQ